MKTLLATLSVLMLVSFAAAAPKKNEISIFLRRTDTLYIQFIDNVGFHGVGQNERFRHFKSTMEEVLEEVDFPMEYKIVRFAANSSPPGQPRLDLTIMKWGDNGMSEIEARFSASLRLDYDRNKLGVFHYRGGTGFASSDQLVRVYNDVLRKALVKMVRELDSHIDLADVPAAAPPAGEEDSDEGGAQN